jgi:hypothetical protein
MTENEIKVVLRSLVDRADGYRAAARLADVHHTHVWRYVNHPGQGMTVARLAHLVDALGGEIVVRPRRRRQAKETP